MDTLTQMRNEKPEGQQVQILFRTKDKEVELQCTLLPEPEPAHRQVREMSTFGHGSVGSDAASVITDTSSEFSLRRTLKNESPIEQSL